LSAVPRSEALSGNVAARATAATVAQRAPPPIESIPLTAARACTFEGTRGLTNASGFFFERDDRLYRVTSRHVLHDEASKHFPDRIEIELHDDVHNVAHSTGFSITPTRSRWGVHCGWWVFRSVSTTPCTTAGGMPGGHRLVLRPACPGRGLGKPTDSFGAAPAIDRAPTPSRMCGVFLEGARTVRARRASSAAPGRNTPCSRRLNATGCLNGRGDAPQIVVGLAVTRDAFPVRRGDEVTEAVLSRPGRYREIADKLEVKEVAVGDGERRRCAVCFNPQEARRQRACRDERIRELEAELACLADQDEGGHSRRVCALRGSARYGRFLKEAKRGLAIDRQAIAELERFDGKFVVHSNDDTLTAENMALGYKQQQRVEEAWRKVRDDLKRIQLAQLSSPNGTVWQVTEPTLAADNRLKALKIKAPPAILKLD
jgi:hypothetical protein